MLLFRWLLNGHCLDKQVQRWILFRTCMERTREKGHTHMHTHDRTQPHTHTHTYMYVHIPTSTRCVLHTPGLFMCVVCMCALVTHVLVQVCRLDET